MNWHPFWLTAQLATLTTSLLLLLCVPLAGWLAFDPPGQVRRRKWLVEVLCNLPLVLPPTVLGFYLLLAFSPASWFGSWLQETLSLRLAFSFSGLVIGSCLFSLPFMLQPLLGSFRQVPWSQIEAARCCGKTDRTTLWRVVLPQCRPALLSGIVLSFAHTVGEFGVVLMLGGNIPGQTRVVSIALYQEVEALNYAAAHRYALLLVLFAFVVLLGIRWLQQQQERC
ncbi:molybdate ABC transporter permease subunit [Permianibacter sp. IMCC34836]|uniref:molybdate ABC transporter permease subunit n=1 Tax=Permianibacter fluminis TaxID=2738515 RepID=UPI001551BC48|nr:molybdate ABC transporter permease subunit [Permianibacter fluminis]NQD36709.1 molybdate ABC transporter permease subunit [Permianibacter fluminis]